jgi:alkanesulfonate monooxygenase SsuD/methylene tetrahydromethanopterin reductase-like flavin-dependent oxidoreductase (luciferase family)
MSRPNIGLHFDLRRHPTDTSTTDQRYAECLEQMVLAENVGFDSVWILEHHFTEDQQSSSPLIMAAAAASRTKRVRIGTNVLLLPLYHPLRLAEDVAMLSLLSGDRFVLGVGAGYNELDFAAFGRDLAHRPSLMEEGVEILRKAWAGTPFEHRGRRWQLPEVTVSPCPSTVPQILMGGFAPAAIKRAARLGDGFMAGSPTSVPIYLDALEELGRPRESGRLVMNVWALISDDPEREWAQVGPHAVEQMNDYVRRGGYGDAPPFGDPDDVIARGQYLLWDGPTAVVELRKIFASYPQLIDVHLFSRMPGESFDSSSRRMEYIAAEVLPHF